MGNLSEVDIFWGNVFYQTIHTAGMKEKKAKGYRKAKGIRGANDFSPLREIG